MQFCIFTSKIREIIRINRDFISDISYETRMHEEISRNNVVLF